MKLKRFAAISIPVILLTGVYLQSGAQQRKQVRKFHKPTAITYLNNGIISDKDSVSVTQFDSLIARPLLVKDSTGKVFTAHSFSFIYVSRGVYSDSTGRPIILSDYLYSPSTGGILPEYWRKGLIPQVKAGDSAIFSDVRYFADTSVNATLLYSNTIKLIISQ